MRVTVHSERCIGSGMCVLTAPGVFDQDEDDGVVRLVRDRPGAEHHAAVREAVGHCPASVISVSED